jgi:hypothetical protein
MDALGQDGGFAIQGAELGSGAPAAVTPLDPPLFPKSA